MLHRMYEVKNIVIFYVLIKVMLTMHFLLYLIILTNTQ